MNNPLFSVLIANYNNGRFLQEAIDSVLEQTYPNWEVIIVDDKSTDNSFEIYEKYKDDGRFHIYYNEKNMGCGYTKRRCAELANGEICGFLDPDDCICKNALHIMTETHIRHLDASLVNSTYFITDCELNVLSQSTNECQIPDNDSFLEYGRGISHFATFKKELYNKTTGIDSGIMRAVDHDLYYKLEEVGRVIYIDAPLYYYRNNTGNNISTGEKAEFAFFWHLLAKADACKRRGLDVEKLVFGELTEYVNSEKEASYSMAENAIRMTKRYRLGKLVLGLFQRK